jgi:uncharacterized delta-60 repeat protein
LVLGLLAMPPAGAGGGTGSLDTGFGDNGTVVVPPPEGAGEVAAAVAALPDGGLVVAGTALPSTGGTVALLLRFRPDGRLDPAFGSGGRVWTDQASAVLPALEAPRDVAAGNLAVFALALQPDGRIVTAGRAERGVSDSFALLRHLPDGRLDRDFGSGGLVVTDLGVGTDDSVSAVALQPDGRIVVAGNSGDRAVLARYLPDGRPDPSFGREGSLVVGAGLIYAWALALQGDGEITARVGEGAPTSGGAGVQGTRRERIIVAGQGGVLGGPYDFAVARYLPDGRPDPSFSGDGVVTTDLGSTGERAAAVAVRPDGTVVAAGSSGASFAVVRYLADGRPDPAFGADGVVTAGPDIGAGQALVGEPDGRLVVAGGEVTPRGRQVAVARYRPDGGMEALVTTDVVPDRPEEAWAAVRQADGKLVVAGGSFTGEFAWEAGPASVILVRYAAAKPE